MTRWQKKPHTWAIMLFTGLVLCCARDQYCSQQQESEVCDDVLFLGHFGQCINHQGPPPILYGFFCCPNDYTPQITMMFAGCIEVEDGVQCDVGPFTITLGRELLCNIMCGTRYCERTRVDPWVLQVDTCGYMTIEAYCLQEI